MLQRTGALAEDDPRIRVFPREPNFESYEPLSEATVAARLAALPGMGRRLGGEPSGWDVREVGDGNLNYVYIVTGPDGSVCVKQALPYVRLVGEGWPLPLSRSFYEHAALVREAHDASPSEGAAGVPAILHFEPGQALIVMENLGRHIIWRKALIARQSHGTAPRRLGRFMAETLFRSSDLALEPGVKKSEAALFAGNVEICRISEDLIFTDPYREHELNRHTPGLEDVVRAIRADGEWKRAIQTLKWDFMCRSEALLHGDLHSGSVMVSDPGPDEDVRVIDSEFAFYGPMGFDVGATIANLMLNYCAQPGHGEGAGAFQAWLLDAVEGLWAAFAERFGELWRLERTGTAFVPALFEQQDDGNESEALLRERLAVIERDAIGFAGAKMARRILGLAHVEDLESLPEDRRLPCERHALRLAREMIVERDGFGGVGAIRERAAATAKED